MGGFIRGKLENGYKFAGDVAQSLWERHLFDALRLGIYNRLITY